MRTFTALIAAASVAAPVIPALAAPGGGGGMGGSPSASAPAYDPAADYARGVAALKQGQFKDASKSLKRVTRAAPGSVEAWRALGESSAGEGDWKTSRRAYEQAARLAPNDVAVHEGLGVAMGHLKDRRAQAELEWLTERSRACGNTCPGGAAIKSALEKVQAAISGQGAAGASAALAGPMIFAGAAAGDLAYSAAVSLINEKRYDEALAQLEAARAVFGPHPDIITYQGYAWRKKGDPTRAEAYYRAALAIAPEHRGATEYYGELKVERGDLPGARLLLARLDAVCMFGCAEAEELRRWIDHGGDPQPR